MIYIKKDIIQSFCKKNYRCGVEINIELDWKNKEISSFLIACQSSNSVPIQLKQGSVNKRSLFGGEKQHYIINVIIDSLIGIRINVFFSYGNGIIYARKLLNSENNQQYTFPDSDNFEYMDSPIYGQDHVNIIIPYNEVKDFGQCQLLLTIVGNKPNSGSTKIEYSISVANEIKEINSD